MTKGFLKMEIGPWLKRKRGLKPPAFHPEPFWTFHYSMSVKINVYILNLQPPKGCSAAAAAAAGRTFFSNNSSGKYFPGWVI